RADHPHGRDAGGDRTRARGRLARAARVPRRQPRAPAAGRIIRLAVTLFQVDDDARLFISPVIENWSAVSAHQIAVIIDLEGGLDECIPTMPGSCLYVYFPIYDEELPDPARLDAVAMMGAHLIKNGHRVLSHCGMGFNRSALVAGRILHYLG